eukprot:SAG31_NODE_25129_length_467_cov_1.038043_1_plen_72_part_00
MGHLIIGLVRHAMCCAKKLLNDGKLRCVRKPSLRSIVLFVFDRALIDFLQEFVVDDITAVIVTIAAPASTT